jgi:hypothetical protein
VKDAVRAGTTKTVRLTVFEEEALVTVKVTKKDAAVVKVCMGFWVVLVEPSPKFHCQAVGDPAEVSVNCTAWPATGEPGANVKDAESAGTTVTVRLVLCEPELLVAVKVTV